MKTLLVGMMALAATCQGGAMPSETTLGLPAASVGEASWDADALDRLISLAGDADTETLMVIHRGEVIVEEYFGNDSGYQQDVASAQKSIVSLLVGMAADKGLLSLDDSVTAYLGVGWAHEAASESDITVRHLLTMTSGLNSRFETVAQPGTSWEYNNNAYHQLRPVLETVAESGIQDLSDDWLFEPLGIQGEWTLRRGIGPGVRDSAGNRLMGLAMGRPTWPPSADWFSPTVNGTGTRSSLPAIWPKHSPRRRN